MNLLMIAAVGIFIVIGCGGQSANDTKAPETGNKTLTTAPAEPKAAPIKIDAKALTKAYEENELAADGKYKGKTLVVTGEISNIAETLGNVTVQLKGNDMLKDVMCSFDESEHDRVAQLKKGSKVTLEGTGDGMTLGIYVGLQSCKVL